MDRHPFARAVPDHNRLGAALPHASQQLRHERHHAAIIARRVNTDATPMWTAMKNLRAWVSRPRTFVAPDALTVVAVRPRQTFVRAQAVDVDRPKQPSRPDAQLSFDMPPPAPAAQNADCPRNPQSLGRAIGQAFIARGIRRPVMPLEEQAIMVWHWLADHECEPVIGERWDRETLTGLIEWACAERTVKPYGITFLQECGAPFVEDAGWYRRNLDFCPPSMRPNTAQVRRFLALADTPASNRTIARACGISESNVTRCVQQMDRAGEVTVHLSGREKFIARRGVVPLFEAA